MPRRPSRPTAAVVEPSLLLARRRRVAEHPVAGGREPAHQPLRLDRVPRPRLRPAMGDAGLDGLLGNLAAVAIEQRQFSTGLIEPALEISPLRHGRPHGCLIGVFMMARWGSGTLAQVGGAARGFPIPRTHAHGRHLLTMIKTSLPRRFIWACPTDRITEWHGGLRAANKARCHAIDHHTPVARPAHLAGRGSPSWFSVRRGDERHGE